MAILRGAIDEAFHALVRKGLHQVLRGTVVPTRVSYHRDLATDPTVDPAVPHDHILVFPRTLSGVRPRVQRPVWARSVL